MYKTFSLLLIAAALSTNSVIANSDRVDNTQESSYHEFAQDYSTLFGEKPGKEWETRLLNCNGGACGGGSDCGSD